MQADPRSNPRSGTFFREDLVMKIFTTILPPLIQEEELSVIVERMYAKYW